MSYRFADSLRAGSGRSWFGSAAAEPKHFHSDDGQRNCLKHVGFYSKNQFEKLVHLVGFTTIITMRSHLNISKG
jgi:hypothetical protein